MSDFYATLLTGEFTLFGILVAVFFFYIQQVSTQFTYRATRSILRDWRLWIFVISVGIAIGMTSTAFAVLNIPGLKTTPLYQFVQGNAYTILTLVFVVASGALFFVLLFIYLRYMDSPTLVKSVSAQAQISQVKDFLHFRYGIPEPPELQTAIVIRAVGLPDPQVTRIAQSGAQDARLIGEARKRFKKLDSRLRKRFKNQPPIDPLTPLLDIAINALNRHDLVTWSAAISQLTALIRAWIENREFTQNAEGMGSWNPESELSSNLAKTLTEHYNFLLETLHNSGHPSLELDVLDSATQVNIAFAKTGIEWQAVRIFLAFWEEQGIRDIYNRRKSENRLL